MAGLVDLLDILRHIGTGGVHVVNWVGSRNGVRLPEGYPTFATLKGVRPFVATFSYVEDGAKHVLVGERTLLAHGSDRITLDGVEVPGRLVLHGHFAGGKPRLEVRFLLPDEGNYLRFDGDVTG